MCVLVKIMIEKSRIEVRVTGEGFSLEKIRPGEVTKLLNTLEAFVIAIVRQETPQIDLTEEGALGFASIGSGNMVAGLVSPHEEVGRAWRKAGRSIKAGDYSHLSLEATEKFLEFVGFNVRHNTESEFREFNGVSNLLAVINTDTPLPKQTVITGTATLYGELLRIGGEKFPSAQLRFTGHGPLTCQVKSMELARAMAERLYEMVGVRGTGKWEATTLGLKEFRVEELTAYRQTTISNAIESLREVAGKYYEEIEDVNAFVADLRGRGPEEE